MTYSTVSWGFVVPISRKTNGKSLTWRRESPEYNVMEKKGIALGGMILKVKTVSVFNNTIVHHALKIAVFKFYFRTTIQTYI